MDRKAELSYLIWQSKFLAICFGVCFFLVGAYFNFFESELLPSIFLTALSISFYPVVAVVTFHAFYNASPDDQGSKFASKYPAAKWQTFFWLALTFCVPLVFYNLINWFH